MLFGGESGGSGLDDTHLFGPAVWTSPDPASRPDPRSKAAAAFVPSHDGIGLNRVVLFGGQEVDQAALCDMWSWNGNGWDEISVGFGGPCLHSHGMAWIQDTGGGVPGLLVVGGYVDTNDTANEDVWIFTFDDATSGSWTTTSLACDGTPQPGARMALDVPSQKSVFFGGEANRAVFADTVVCQ